MITTTIYFSANRFCMCICTSVHEHLHTHKYITSEKKKGSILNYTIQKNYGFQPQCSMSSNICLSLLVKK